MKNMHVRLPATAAAALAMALVLPAQADTLDLSDPDMAQTALVLPLLLHSGGNTARAGINGWFERQTDLRDTHARGDTEGRGGVWSRIHYGSATHEVDLDISGEPQRVNDYDADTYGLAVGFDVAAGTLGTGRWLAGVTAGYTRSTMTFDQLPIKGDFDSVGVGAYAAWVGDDFFLDVMLRQDWMESDLEAPVLGIHDNPALTTKVRALTAHAEGGMRFDMGTLRLEPLLGLTFVTLSTDDMNIPPPEPPLQGAEGHRVMFGSHESQRASAGVRMSIPQVIAGMHLEYAVTARYVQEFSRDADVTLRLTEAGEDQNMLPIRVPVEDVHLSHQADSSLTEVVAGVAFNNASGQLSTLLNATAQFGSRYDAWSVSWGLRYQW